MDGYKEDGVFPNTVPEKKSMHFKGPIRCHHRARSFLPLVIYLLWAYFTLPSVLKVLNIAFGAGFVSVLAGAAIFGISNLST